MSVTVSFNSEALNELNLWIVAPIFESRIKQMVQQSTNDPNGVLIDITSVVHHVMSESMLSLFLGKVGPAFLNQI